MATNNTNVNKGGRPKKEIDKRVFEELCSIMCTQQEIANIIDCHADTIQAWCKRTYGTGFSEVYKRFADRGKQSLRRAQFNLAHTNAAMAIWLGKQYLGQRDIQEIETTDTFRVKIVNDIPDEEDED